MQDIEKLISIIETLIGPNGCPWDQKQTMKSIRADIIEEAAEIVEAIDLEDNAHIREELGDILFIALFTAKLAEKEKRCTLEEAAQGITEKLIRRHPHVFGDAKCSSSEEVVTQWNQIKAEEKSHRKSALDGIPKSLPSLSRAHEFYKKFKKAKFIANLESKKENPYENETSLGHFLLKIAFKAEEEGLDAEHALRNALSHLEKEFRNQEKI